MTNQDWTPPEVVYLPKLKNNWVFADIEDGSERNVTTVSDSETNVYAVSYTLTSSVEKAKRKAVREVLKKVRDGVFPKGMKGGMVHINRHWWEQYFEKLLTQYQDPQPTDVQDV